MFFGAVTLVFYVISIRAKSHQTLVENESPLILVPQLEEFTQCIFLSNWTLALRLERTSEFILRPLPLIFIPTMLYFWAKPRSWRAIKKRPSPLFEIASVLVRLDHVAR